MILRAFFCTSGNNDLELNDFYEKTLTELLLDPSAAVKTDRSSFPHEYQEWGEFFIRHESYIRYNSVLGIVLKCSVIYECPTNYYIRNKESMKPFEGGLNCCGGLRIYLCMTPQLFFVVSYFSELAVPTESQQAFVEDLLIPLVSDCSEWEGGLEGVGSYKIITFLSTASTAIVAYL